MYIYSIESKILQTNVREEIVVWIITQDDFKEEGDSQVEETSSMMTDLPIFMLSSLVKDII